jgi:CRP/FNR family transcriptional regulator, anaerobic regulatory protein
MQSFEAASIDQARHPLGSTHEVSEFPGLFRRHVRIGSTLFQPGEPRQLYRVESGAICHYVQPAEGQYEIIEFAFSGDVIGLGRLKKHVTIAKAMVEATVSVLSEADIDRALTNDNRLVFRIAEAREREFDYLKNRSLKEGLGSPIQRVANFLLAIVSLNASEGRALMFVTDDVSSGYAAEQLQMSIDALASALLSLRRSGVVDVSESGLRILDVNALETLATDA